MTKIIEIDELLYLELLDDSNFLQALRMAGVDNWEGYGEAMSAVYGDDDEESEEDIYGG